MPLSVAVALTTSSMSRTIESKSAVDSGWNTIAAAPRELIPSPVSIVTFAVLLANSRSGAGLSSLRRPVRMSRRPTRLGGALELSLEALEARDPGLERRVRRDQRPHRLLG